MKRRNFLRTAGAGSAALTGLAAIPAYANGTGSTHGPIDPKGLKIMSGEPTLNDALEYWPDQEGFYTPLGWPDSMYSFGVFWNGSIAAKPSNCRRWAGWPKSVEKLGAFYRLIPTSSHAVNHVWTPGSWQDINADEDYALTSDYRLGGGNFRDANFSKQRMEKGTAASVLTTRWTYEGVVLESSIFAWKPGGKECKRGDEPLYVWARLSVAKIFDGLPIDDEYGFHMVVENDAVRATGNFRDCISMEHDRSYPRKLNTSAEDYNPDKGLLLLEDNGKVRMGVAAGAQCRTRFSEFDGNLSKFGVHHIIGDLTALSLFLKPEVGEHVDLLLPMLATNEEDFSALLATGYDKALTETERFWEERARGTEAKMDLPEAYLNDVMKENINESQLSTELNINTGKYCKTLGSWAFNMTWAMGTHMDLVMHMDMLGYHDFVEKYLYIFKDEQGTVTPPGDEHIWQLRNQENKPVRGAYKRHPGYLASPQLYKAIDWVTDNGAVLYGFAMHGLLSGNREYIDSYTDAIIKSCEWTRDVCAQTNHDGYKGILPPGVSCDTGLANQEVFPQTWTYLGLCKAVKLLERIDHPRAAEFAKVRDDFYEAFRKVYYDCYESMPAWTGKDGKKRKFGPIVLYGHDPASFRHRFYFPTGPLSLVFSGLLPLDDPTIKDTLEWFRNGPITEEYMHDSDTRKQSTIIKREMPSTLPCHAWNIFHSLWTGDREKFIMGLYSLWAGSFSRQTYTPCENRNIGFGMGATMPIPLYLSRLALVDEVWKQDEVHLLRMPPKAWLENGGFKLEKIPTEHGPVTFSGRLAEDGTLELKYSADYHWKPEKVVMHVPQLPEIKAVRLNGERVEGDEITL